MECGSASDSFVFQSFGLVLMGLHICLSVFVVFFCEAVDPLSAGPYCGYGNNLKLFRTAVRLLVAALRVFFNHSISGTIGLSIVLLLHLSVLGWRMATPP